MISWLNIRNSGEMQRVSEILKNLDWYMFYKFSHLLFLDMANSLHYNITRYSQSDELQKRSVISYEFINIGLLIRS